jgi:acyl carrier protein
MGILPAGGESQVRCPACGNRELPEFTAPPGVAICPQCGSLLRRSSEGMVPVGVSSEILVHAVLRRLREDGLLGQTTEEEIRQTIAARLGIEALSLPPGVPLADLGVDSLDVVELVMALEEEFGVDLDLR